MTEFVIVLNIDEKRMNTVFHDQLYQQRMIHDFNKIVRSQTLEEGQLVLKYIFPIKKSIIGNLYQIGKDHTWFVKCYLEVH